jgi:putative transposase
MDEMDIHVFYPGPNLSKRDKKSKVYPYLLRNLKIDRPNQVWAIDITYVGTPCGFAYMVAIIDWYSRFIVGWAISNTLQTPCGFAYMVAIIDWFKVHSGLGNKQYPTN